MWDYLILARGGVELQFFLQPDVDPLTTSASCYVRVDDADALHSEWSRIGVPSDPATGSRLTEPVTMDYGMRQFALVDPSGNLVNVGSDPAAPRGPRPVPTQADKAAAFAALHEGQPFVIPNPWDAGSARVLEALGFPALTTTSSGFAFTLGRLDSSVTLDELAVHVELLASVTSVPLAVDIENGFGPTPEDAARAVGRVAAAGAVGGSIEDWDPSGRLYDRGASVERVAAAVEAARGLPFPFVLAARAENHIRGNPDLDDTIARLQAYEAAGADVLYAPGLRTVEEIRTVCDAVSKPVNVLALPGLSVPEIFAAGAQRVSVGGGLAWVAVGAFAAAAEAIRDSGDLAPLGVGLPLRDWLAQPHRGSPLAR